MKLQLKHLAGYLPYKALVNDGRTPFELTQHNFTNVYPYIDKIHLRPLSDLTKEIEVNGEKFVPIEKLKERDSNIEFLGWYQYTFAFRLDEKAIGIMAMPYYIIQQLLEWHFDIYGLIEKGLAIDVNTLNK